MQNLVGQMLIRYCIEDGKKRKQAKIYTKDEHKIDLSKIDKDAIKIIKKLVIKGYDAYLVGGAVRDLVIGNTPKDFDITTNATPRIIKKCFRNSRVIGKRFRLVHIFFGKKIFEVSTFRSTENGSVGNQFGTMEEDAHRRDFTINALYFDPINLQIIDFVDGLEDLKNKRLKPIIPMGRLFTEDPVRMIRAVKYSVMTNCKMGFFLRWNIRRSSYLLEEVSHSRLTEEMSKIINSGYAEAIIRKLYRYELYMYLQANAFILIKEDTANFKNKYLESLRELDQKVMSGEISRQGMELFYLIKDFLHLVLDEVGHESPLFFYTEARHFILPLNPQKMELHFAVLKFLRENLLYTPRKRRKQNRRKNKTQSNS